MEQITAAPAIESFTPLSSYQSSTPDSFFTGPPVLFLHAPGARVIASNAEYEACAELKAMGGVSAQQQQQQAGSGTNGSAASSSETKDGAAAVLAGSAAAGSEAPCSSDGGERVIGNVDVWVTSQALLLFSPTHSNGISIPYPSIALHALGTYDSATGPVPAVILQLNLSPPEADTNPEAADAADMLGLTLVVERVADVGQGPGAGEGPGLQGAEVVDGHGRGDGVAGEMTPARRTFDALCACADLHPDPEEQDGLGGVPGEGGWFTGEQGAGLGGGLGGMGGGWIMAEDVQSGAVDLESVLGRVRRREEEGGEGMGENDDGEEDGGVQGNGEETKWRRTG